MIDRTKLSHLATYEQMADSLTQYGGTNSVTSDDMPADGIFRVSRGHYDPEAETDEDTDYSGNGQMNNVRVFLAFAVDFEGRKLLLADAEFELTEVDESPWPDATLWVLEPRRQVCVARTTNNLVFLTESEVAMTWERDTPGVFQVYENDLEELRRLPHNLDGVGSCEPHEFAVMDLPNLAALSAIILNLWDNKVANSYLIQEEDVVKEEYGEGMDTGKSVDVFYNYIGFDCRRYLKPAQVYPETKDAE